jgi:hypothetical protein
MEITMEGKKRQRRAGGVAQAIEFLSNKVKAMNSNLSTAQKGGLVGSRANIHNTNGY